MTTTADEDGAGAAAATTARATGRVVKRGLPTLGLVEAENAASKLWDVARRGMTAQTAFAKELGLNKASGGAWAAHLAHLRGFGVVLVKGDEIGLSPIGLDLAEDFDDAKRLAARRKAVMTLKSYRELVQDYDQTTLPAMDKIASKLEHEYGKNADFAKQAAAAFIASLKHAQMLDSNNVVRKAGADTMDDGAGQASTETMPPEPSTTDDNPTEDDPTEDQIDKEIDDAFDEAQNAFIEEPPFIDPRSGGGTATVALSMTLDLSRYPAAEVITILRALGLAARG